METEQDIVKKQQDVATEILRMANAAGMACIVWTLEDTLEATRNELQRQGKDDKDALYIAQEVLDDSHRIEQDSIEFGWRIITDLVYDACMKDRTDP